MDIMNNVHGENGRNKWNRGNEAMKTKVEEMIRKRDIL